MVDLSICCSEHDVSMCFSEHGGTLLMSCRSWAEPVSRIVDMLQRVREECLLGMEPCLGGCEIVSSGHGRFGPPSLGRSYVLEYFLFLSDLGRFLLVQACYLIKGRFPFILRHDKSLGLEAGGWRRGLRPGGRDPNPGAGTRNLEAGTLKPEAGVIS
ncbi:hypothetical protein F2Q68_00005395 [Brassica cretica]|uniref:Uncharacterized protein n=1 Tax=Brassica cretica TaxID=69181 RepID=A0A8S9JNR1_BRACR|nr:hypothetical protein F2Q68_00005395 [Brassica cretica]